MIAPWLTQTKPSSLSRGNFMHAKLNEQKINSSIVDDLRAAILFVEWKLFQFFIAKTGLSFFKTIFCFDFIFTWIR